MDTVPFFDTSSIAELSDELKIVFLQFVVRHRIELWPRVVVATSLGS